MALLRGGQTDEYYLFLYAKTTNDYRRPNNSTTPRHLWQQYDFGLLRFSFYEKVKAAINTKLLSQGYDKFLLFENQTVHEARPFLYVVKYGDEITDVNRLFPIEVEDLSELESPDITQLAIVVSQHPNPITSLEYDPMVLNIQAGIPVPLEAPQAPVAAANAVNWITNYGAQGGSQRRTRRHRRARRATRRRA